MKFLGGVGHWPRTNQLHFGVDPDKDTDPEFVLSSVADKFSVEDFSSEIFA